MAFICTYSFVHISLLSILAGTSTTRLQPNFDKHDHSPGGMLSLAETENVPEEGLFRPWTFNKGSQITGLTCFSALPTARILDIDVSHRTPCSFRCDGFSFHNQARLNFSLLPRSKTFLVRGPILVTLRRALSDISNFSWLGVFFTSSSIRGRW